MKINEVQAKTILTKSGLPDADWVLNPYIGCGFGCIYCYACFIGRMSHPGEEWGSFVDVKTNAPALLKKELEKLEAKHSSKDFGAIFLSSVTDPYHQPESKYKITRACLKTLADFGYKGEVSILTKSPLVLRDLDLLKRLAHVSVGLTITGLNDPATRFIEAKAPPLKARLLALKQLNAANIPTYAFVGPVLPYYTAKQKQLTALFKKIAATGTREIYIEHLNLQASIRERLYKFLKQKDPSLIKHFEAARQPAYRQKFEKMVRAALAPTNLKLRAGGIIFHS